MVKLKGFSIIESVMSLALITGTVLLASIIFSNVLKNQKNGRKVKAIEIIESVERGESINDSGLYTIEVTRKVSSHSVDVEEVWYEVFYRDQLITRKRVLQPI